jgi:hypothetical protein
MRIAPSPRASRISRIFASAATLIVVSGAGLMAAPGAGASIATLHPLGARPLPYRIAPTVPMSATTVLPTSVNLRAYAVPVGNQGAVGSCVTWAINYGMLGWYSKKLGRIGQPFAPMFTYSQIHVGGGDNGSYPTDALAVAQSQGSDTKAHYSHGDFDWRDTPNAGEVANAAHWKISGYQTLFVGASSASVNAIKTALAASHPVAITIPVRPGFDNMGHATTSVDNDTTGGIRGYHEVLALGYDAAGVVIQNSWGTGWGAAGFGKLSWSVVTKDVVEAETMSGFAADVADPDVMSVTAAPAAMPTLTATIPYKISWTAMGSIASYQISYTVNGGAPNAVTLPAAKSTSYTFAATPGSTYAFTVRAVDGLAQASSPVTSASFTPTVLQQSSGAIAYGGTWASKPVVSASEGTLAASSTIGASATLSLTARSLAFIAAKATTYGAAKIYVDGVLKATVNLYSLTAVAKANAYSIDFGTPGAHSISVVEVGTLGRPAVNVDAFVVTS